MKWLSAFLICLFVFCCAGATRGYYYDYPTRRPPPSYSAAYQRYQSSRYSRQSDDGNRSDKENAKFAGASNQELDEFKGNDDNGDAKTLLLKKKLRKALYRPFGGGAGLGYGNPCLPFGRDAAGKGASDVEQGRFLFDVNVYNVYGGGGGYGGGCRGYGGGVGAGLGAGLGGLLGGAGGLLSDPIAQPPLPIVPVRPYAPFATWLSLFAPGILQNSLAATVPGVPLADPIRPTGGGGGLQSDPEVDPNYAVPVRRPVPNRIYYDTAGAPPVTPGQLLGGVSTTVNGIIQQLTGQVQPVYQTGAYRARQRSSYG